MTALTTRRRFLARAGALGAGLAAAPLLAACSDTTVAGGQDPHLAPGGLPLARPDNPVTLPIYPHNRPIASGLRPEAGPLQLYNWAEYMNVAVIKSFERRYGVKVQLSTFGTMDEAIAKLAAGAVGFDVFVPTQPYISMLVAGRILQPINLSYIPNLHANVWPLLTDPWYDRGSRYTVPYTVYTTGIAWRNDFLPHYHPTNYANPYESFWREPGISGRVGILQDEREALSFALLRNGVTDVNTGDDHAVYAARDGLMDLTNKVNLRFDTNEYQHLADGSSWLHQAWSGDIGAIGYYMPKGTSPKVVSYWWPQDGRGLMGNDTLVVLKGAKNPVLAHLFLNHLLDSDVAFTNFAFTGYQQPVKQMTPEKVIATGDVPRNLETTVLREDQFRHGYLYGPLSAAGLSLWETAWSQVQAS